MPLQRWSPELIVQRIRELRDQGSDLTPSEVRARDGALVSAAERYFGNWPAAVSAAGIDYDRVRQSGRRRRSARITQWSRERIIAEILRLHRAGEDLSWGTMERKHQPLCAAAVKQCYFGSWRAAVAAAGLDYDDIKRAAREARRRRTQWHQELAGADTGGARPAESGASTAARGRSRPPAPTAPPDWSRDLLHEKAAEDRRKSES